MGRNVKNGGFSIVEIVISLLLVSVALITIVSVFPKISESKKVIREVDEAYSIAAYVLDSLRSVSSPISSTSTQQVVKINTVFKYEYIIVDKDFFRSANVEVFWDKGGKEHRINLAGVVQ